MTAKRTLTIRIQPDWQAGLRDAARQSARSRTYQGETLAFETPGAFLGRLTQRRWALVLAMQGRGMMSVREAARLVGRDVKRVHEDIVELLELGLLERDKGGVSCPFADIHVDFHLQASAA